MAKFNEILEKAKKFFGKEEKIIDYPDSWILVRFSDVAIEDGTEDDLNRIIDFNHLNRFGRKVCTSYPYSDERLASLLKVYNVPIFNKTEQKIKFPIYAKMNPGEITYVE
jgi:hypothetical protein